MVLPSGLFYLLFIYAYGIVLLFFDIISLRSGVTYRTVEFGVALSSSERLEIHLESLNFPVLSVTLM